MILLLSFALGLLFGQHMGYYKHLRDEAKRRDFVIRTKSDLRTL